MAFVNAIYARQTTAFKLNLAFGYILRHMETGAVRYFRPFEHEGVLDNYIYISRRLDLARLEKKLRNLNLLEMLLMQRQNTKWVIEILTNVRFTVSKIKFLLGNSDAAVPQYTKNRAIYSLVSDKLAGKMYRDNLCAFRCLALHQGHHLKNLEAVCRKNFERWELTQESKSPFQGIMLQTDMPRFEQCFEVPLTKME